MPYLLVVWALLGPPSGEIAYVSEPPEGGSRVYVADLERGTVRAIGPERAVGGPVWSPDGARIAFAAQRGEGVGIYVADAQGDHGAFASGKQGLNRWPVWSPEGDRLAYAVGDGLDSQVAVYDFETGQESLWGGERTSLLRPVWSPPGLTGLLLNPEESERLLEVALAPAMEPPSVLVCVGLVGTPGALTTDLFVLTEREAIPIREDLLPSRGAYAEWLPAASADGLAFESNDGGDREIFVITREGAWDISNHRTADWHPVWSPNGKWLAFESFRDGKRGIYRTYQDTARVYPVAVEASGACWDPTWSPDGNAIAYVSDRDGTPGIYAAQIDPAELMRVTPPGLAAHAPAWRPVR